MELKEKIEKRLVELKSDERLTYPTANVFVNAPLSLIQYGMGCEINMLEEMLDLPLSKFPLKK